MSRALNREAMALDPALAEMFELLYAQAQAQGLFTGKNNLNASHAICR